MSNFQEAAEEAADAINAQQEANADQKHESQMVNSSMRLLEGLMTVASLQVALEDLRKDPDASAEKMMSAAQAFRAQEAEISKLMQKMVADEVRHIRGQS